MPSKFTLINCFLQENLFKYLFVLNFMVSLRNIKLERVAFAVKEQLKEMILYNKVSVVVVITEEVIGIEKCNYLSLEV